MTSLSPVSDSAHHPGLVLARFFERAQRYSFHELRGRIGTIANFAAVLESGQVSAEEALESAGKIRVQALTAARMMQIFGTAIELASRPLRRLSMDCCRLAQSVLTDAGGHGTVQCAGPDPIADVDADLVAFAWRAFVALQGDPAGGRIVDWVLSVSSTPHGCELELRSGSGELAPPGPDAPEADIQSYVHEGTGGTGGPEWLENGLALTLAYHLVASHEGRMELRGRPGGGSSLRLALPTTETAGSVL